MEYLITTVIDSAESYQEERIRLKAIRDTSDPFQLEEEKFRKLFRLSKSGAFDLIETLQCPSLTENFIPKHIKILSALNFFAQGSYQAAVGQDNFLGLSQPSVSRCLDAAVNAIVRELGQSKIKFPMTASEKASAKQGFQELFGIPNTLGAIDGTHVAITKPPINHPTSPGSLYYNRKGFYSINCQIICSAQGKIIGFNPNYPGSTHDAAIWRLSRIHQFLRQEYICGESF